MPTFALLMLRVSEALGGAFVATWLMLTLEGDPPPNNLGWLGVGLCIAMAFMIHQRNRRQGVAHQEGTSRS